MAWFKKLQLGGLVYETPPYTTELTPAEERAFRTWYDNYATINKLDHNPDDPLHYYDYRGYWKANKDNLEIPTYGMHLPDTWKRPGHETFSDQSIYADETAGRWVETNPTGHSIFLEDEEFVRPLIVDSNELLKRQRFAESSFKDNLTSAKGAKGAYQIMPGTYAAYVKATGDQGDLFDYNYNKKVRDWYMGRLLQSKTITNGNPTDVVRLAKQYAAYNWGQGNLGNYLQKKKDEDMDIYRTLDWIEGLPKETRDYVKFVVLGEDVKGTHKTNENYNKNAGKYQRGGLVYTPFLQDYDTSEQVSPEDDVFTTLPEQPTPFKVEPVKAYTPQQFEIKAETPKEEIKKRGKTTFKKDGIDVGNMRELLDKFEEAGISVRVTSGMESMKRKSGNKSKHPVGDAIDITPGVGETYESIRAKIKANPELLAYMQDNGIGIIDETDPLMMIRTGATGKHWHISRGGERLAIHGFNKLFG